MSHDGLRAATRHTAREAPPPPFRHCAGRRDAEDGAPALAAEELPQHWLEAPGELGVAFDARVEAVHGQVRHDAVVEGLDQPGALAPRDVTKSFPVDVRSKSPNGV